MTGRCRRRSCVDWRDRREDARPERARRSRACRHARDIGFALWRSPFRVKRDQGIDVCRLIAEAVTEHLPRCDWRTA